MLTTKKGMVKMAQSTCVKCGSTNFELSSTAHKIYNAATTFYFVQCSKCGGVVGVVNNVELNAQISTVEESVNRKVQGLGDKLTEINERLYQIQHRIK